MAKTSSEQKKYARGTQPLLDSFNKQGVVVYIRQPLSGLSPSSYLQAGAGPERRARARPDRLGLSPSYARKP